MPPDDETLSLEEEQDEEARQQELHERRILIEDDILLKVLNTYEGRHVLYNVLGLGDIHDFQAPMSFETAKFQRQQGRKDVANELLKDFLRVDHRVYILMQREAEQFEEQFLRENEDG